jgi:hypothetical protein
MTRRFASVALLTVLASVAGAQKNDFHWEKALPAGNEVSIHNINGNITVLPSTNGRVEVVGVKRGSGNFDRIKADVQQTSRGISVCVLLDEDSYCDDRGTHTSNRNNRSNHDGNDVRIDLEVSVPMNLQVSANSVSGSISMTGASGDVRANTVSGDVKLDRLRASSVSAQSVSGDVEVSVQEFTGRGDLTFQSVSGDITLDLPRQLDADLSMSTVSGAINSDFAMTIGDGRVDRRSLRATIGRGGRRLDFSTVSGSVKLRAAR